MKQAPNALYRSLRLLVLTGACLVATAHADGYADVSKLMGDSKFSEAMSRVNSHLAANPSDPQMRFFKGVIQSSQGKPLEAIATFTALTQDYPELPEPYNNLAVLYAGQGSYDQARLALEMAIRTNPSYATAQENLGDVYARLASQAYNKALELDSSNTAASRKLGLISEFLAPSLGKSRPPASTPAVTESVMPADAPTAATATPAVVPQPPAASINSAPVADATDAASNTEPASVPIDAEANKAVETAVLAWAQAWSDKNVAAYLKAYSPRFSPAGNQSLSDWEQQRDDRITDKTNISVTVSNLNIRVQGDQAVASFHQAYVADGLSVASQNILELENSDQNWLITRESTDR